MKNSSEPCVESYIGQDSRRAGNVSFIKIRKKNRIKIPAIISIHFRRSHVLSYMYLLDTFERSADGNDAGNDARAFTMYVVLV